MNNYIFNKETLKIELHFEKSEYNALSEQDKKELKSNFLWSNYGKCWVSRCKEPHLYYAKKTAQTLGFEGMETTGERLTYAEQLERKAEKAENRAERYEEYAANAEKRAVNYQAELNSFRGDIAFFTQPIIANHSGSQAFARYRERVYNKYHKGFEEYRKSDYFKERADTARATADNVKLQDRVYLHNRIKECNKKLKGYQESIIKCEEYIYRIEQGETLKNTKEQHTERLEYILEVYEAEQDKLDFMENCLEELGGIQFSKKNIKVGYIVEVSNFGAVEVVAAGTVNFSYKTRHGGILTDPYVAIKSIVKAKEKTEDITNPYAEGDILTSNRPADNSIYQAWQVVGKTEKSVKLRRIAVENYIPQRDKFISDETFLKKIVKSKYSDSVGVWHDDWQLHKYTAI